MKFVKGKKAVAVDLRPARCICAIPGESDICPVCGPTLKTEAEHTRRMKVAAKSYVSEVGLMPLRTTKAGITGNPWIDRRHFDTMMARCVQAEEMCKRLIAVIAVDDGEFLASHDYDYLAAGHAVLKGDV